MAIYIYSEVQVIDHTWSTYHISFARFKADSFATKMSHLLQYGIVMVNVMLLLISAPEGIHRLQTSVVLNCC
jgi:hypothetical protein